MLLRYILFHHQTTTAVSVYAFFFRCVISSFITKPQLIPKSDTKTLGCVISSFITKPQLPIGVRFFVPVALYPLSSPNHNDNAVVDNVALLRYILFHHQTTTKRSGISTEARCVISSFITKPQRSCFVCFCRYCCVISSFITKPQQTNADADLAESCVISGSPEKTCV